jgi:dihydroneopterin aldolase
MNPLDQIILTGLRASAFHGVLEHERRTGQVFVIDVAVHLSLAQAAESDDLDQTIHYGELAEEIVAAVVRDPVDLIETVAERVADVVLAHERAVFVEVTVHKPSAPIEVPFEDVAVKIARARPERMRTAGFSTS